MRARPLVIAGAAVAGAAALAVLAPRLRARHEATREIPAELRNPLLYMPVHIHSHWRVRMMRRSTLVPTKVRDGVVLTRETVPGERGGPEVELYVYRTPRRVQPSGALLWIHGGGYLIGHPSTYHHRSSRIADELGLVVVAPVYRLAPENPFPAGLNDVLAALRWLHANASALGIDPARIAVGGDSAGGGLAATLAQRAHDEGGLPIAFQLLEYPMLDDRTGPHHHEPGTGHFVWTARSNEYAWQCYLGSIAGDPPPYAAAARRVDLAGLPPAWIGVGDIDLFHAEDVEYARRLEEAGVSVELVVVPGLYHGADAFMSDKSAIAGGFTQSMLDALARALA